MSNKKYVSKVIGRMRSRIDYNGWNPLDMQMPWMCHPNRLQLQVPSISHQGSVCDPDDTGCASSKTKIQGTDGDRTRGLWFTRPTPYHLATAPQRINQVRVKRAGKVDCFNLGGERYDSTLNNHASQQPHRCKSTLVFCGVGGHLRQRLTLHWPIILWVYLAFVHVETLGKLISRTFINP